MLLAIDIGNTHLVAGIGSKGAWKAVWRRSTSADDTEDQLAAWLSGMCQLSSLPFACDAIVCASVVPSLNQSVERMAKKWLQVPCEHLTALSPVGISVRYEPKSAVGADRIANALGAMDRYQLPLVIVDFGTATTFDAVDRTGTYMGGAILPGVEVSAQALFGRTAKLPQIELKTPKNAIGATTTESLQSGIVLGYAGAINALTARIDAELGGGATVVATGGLGAMFMDLCDGIQAYEPNLTLDGLAIAYERIRSAS